MSAITLSEIRQNTSAWKASSRDNQFRLLNNGVCLQISREQYAILEAQFPNPEPTTEDFIHLYLGINTAEGPQRDGLVAYVLSAIYDKAIGEDEGAFDAAKIIEPTMLGAWPEGASEGAQAIEIPSITSDNQANEAQLGIVQRLLRWKIYGGIWAGFTEKETVQVFSIRRQSLSAIFDDGNDITVDNPITDAVVFWAMKDYEEDGQIKYTNELEACLCGKHERYAHTSNLETFLKFYNFRNITVPRPPFGQKGQVFALLKEPLNP